MVNENPRLWIRLNSKYCSDFMNTAPYRWIQENAPQISVYLGYNIKYEGNQLPQLTVFIDSKHKMVAAKLKMMFG